MRGRKIQLSASLSAFLLLAACTQAVDQPRTADAIYQQVLRSTAWVRVYQDNKLRKMGTGFLVDRARKLVVTNQHVVDNQESVEVVFPLYHGSLAIADKKNYVRYDRPIRGWVVAMDPKRDLAVIELEIVPHAAAAMRLAADSVVPGEHIHLIGNPGTSELLWVYNAGTVHQVSSRRIEDHRNGRVLDAMVAEVRTRASVRPGYSGGPVVNDRGELAGVATMSNPAAHWAWCVDITEINDVLRIVRDHPKAAQRLLNPRSAIDYRDREAYERKSGPADQGIARWTEALERAPQNAAAYLHRGAAFARRREWAKAVADFTAGLHLAPTDAPLLYNRGLAYIQQGSEDLALIDFSAILRIEPKDELAYLDRGLLHSRRGQHSLAVGDFEQALRLDVQETAEHPDHYPLDGEAGIRPSAKLDYTKLLLPDPPYTAAFHSLAWVWATSPDTNRRDGKTAVEFATKACQLSGWKNATYLSTLAAAYAESTNFDEAIHWQKQALRLASETEKNTFRSRLELFQSRRPLREKGS